MAILDQFMVAKSAEFKVFFMVAENALIPWCSRNFGVGEIENAFIS